MTPGETRPIRLAVVGGGRVTSAVHLPLLRLMPETYEVVAVVDSDAGRRSSLATEFPGPQRCATLAEALPLGLDAMLCATPWPTHAGLVRLALMHDLPVLCEKPVTLDPVELDELAALKRECSAQVSVGYMKRHDPVVARFVDALGCARDRLRHVVVTILDPNAAHQVGHRLPTPLEPRPETRMIADEVVRRVVADRYSPADRYAYAHGLGGSLIHQINLVHAGLGVSLAGRLGYARHWADGTAVACGWWPADGVAVQMSHVRVPAHRDYAEMVQAVTEDCCLTLQVPSPYQLDRTAVLIDRHANGDQRVWTSAPQDNGFVRQLRAWAAAMRADGPGLPGLADAVRDLGVVCEAADLAAGVRPCESGGEG
jgi:predicted dehydrogenase